MGMLRLRFVGSKKMEPTAADLRFAVLIERLRDHTFLDFSGWTPPAVPGDVPHPPVNWTASFGRPAKGSIEMVQMKNFTNISTLLDEVWWIDIDASKFEDADYCVYFYSITDSEMQHAILVSVVGGDDTSIDVRLKQGVLRLSINGNFSGLPGGGNCPVNVKATANMAVALPQGPL